MWNLIALVHRFGPFLFRNHKSVKESLFIACEMNRYVRSPDSKVGRQACGHSAAARTHFGFVSPKITFTFKCTVLYLQLPVDSACTVATCQARRVARPDLQGVGLFVEKNSPIFVFQLKSTKIGPRVLTLFYDAVPTAQ